MDKGGVKKWKLNKSGDNNKNNGVNKSWF
jgi:hypothetical protein